MAKLQKHYSREDLFKIIRKYSIIISMHIGDGTEEYFCVVCRSKWIDKSKGRRHKKEKHQENCPAQYRKWIK